MTPIENAIEKFKAFKALYQKELAALQTNEKPAPQAHTPPTKDDMKPTKINL